MRKYWKDSSECKEMYPIYVFVCILNSGGVWSILTLNFTKASSKELIKRVIVIAKSCVFDKSHHLRSCSYAIRGCHSHIKWGASHCCQFSRVLTVNNVPSSAFQFWILFWHTARTPTKAKPYQTNSQKNDNSIKVIIDFSVCLSLQSRICLSRSENPFWFNWERSLALWITNFFNDQTNVVVLFHFKFKVISVGIQHRHEH